MNESLRDLVFQRAAGYCEYCRVSQQFDPITVEVLEINLSYRVVFRRELVEEGVFPPG
ncbi:MAG: hypothetical protein IID44_18945 [Planctomycetes bacterium]|nr:hypothetical protein [Planctomycetota bacterium]